MCANPSNHPGITPLRPRGGIFGGSVKDLLQAKNPTSNPIDRTIRNWSSTPQAPQQPQAAANPMGLAAANKATTAVDDSSQIGSAFLNPASPSPQTSTKNGYKVVG